MTCSSPPVATEGVTFETRPGAGPNGHRRGVHRHYDCDEGLINSLVSPFYPALTCGVFVFPVLRPQFSQARPATGRDLAAAVAKAARTAREPEARRQAAATARQVSIGLPRPHLSADRKSPVAERPAHRRACAGARG